MSQETEKKFKKRKRKKKLKGDVSVGTIPVGQDTFLGQGTQDGYQG